MEKNGNFSCYVCGDDEEHKTCNDLRGMVTSLLMCVILMKNIEFVTFVNFLAMHMILMENILFETVWENGDFYCYVRDIYEEYRISNDLKRMVTLLVMHMTVMENVWFATIWQEFACYAYDSDIEYRICNGLGRMVTSLMMHMFRVEHRICSDLRRMVTSIIMYLQYWRIYGFAMIWEEWWLFLWCVCLVLKNLQFPMIWEEQWILLLCISSVEQHRMCNYLRRMATSRVMCMFNSEEPRSYDLRITMTFL